MSEIFKEIEKTIKENQVVLFMKGNKSFPQCGFSSFVVQILQNLQVDFHDVDILKDEDLRQAIKDYSNPTISQLYER